VRPSPARSSGLSYIDIDEGLFSNRKHKKFVTDNCEILPPIQCVILLIFCYECELILSCLPTFSQLFVACNP